MTTYQYSPLNEDLNEIRVLTLHPGKFSADIHVSIHKVPLTAENPPIYEALSYVWGTTDSPVEIRTGRPREDTLHQCGCLPFRRHLARNPASSRKDRLSITQNLATALPYLRYKDRIRTFWIDAICIDQRNLRERSSQVSRMGDIYRLAHRVIVWLGTENDNSAHVLRTLSHLGSQIKVDYVSSKMSPASSDSNPYWSDTSKTLPYSSQELRDMDALLHRSWFSRLWVWQEIRLAKNNSILVCGSETILWQTFRRAIFCLFYKYKAWDSHLIKEAIKLKTRAAHVLDASNTETLDTLGGTVRRLASCKCSDPRDRIYAVLGLLGGFDRDVKINPDYTQTTAQVYRDVILRFIEHQNLLGVLIFCELQSDRPAEMPTWVPNWDDAHTAKRIITGGSACGDSVAKVQYKGDGVLSVTGVISATVSTAEEIIVQDEDDLLFDQMRKLAAPNIEDSAYVSGGSLIDAFVRTFCANNFNDRMRPRREDYPHFQSSRDMVLAVLQNRDVIPDFYYGDDVSKYLTYVTYICDKKSFIKTIEGYIGIAPKATRPGDQVCVILGCDKPLVLRPTSSLQYQVVGLCYVHGIAEGEALLDPLPDSYQAIQVYVEAKGYYSGFVNRDTGNLQYNDPRMEDDQVISAITHLICPDGSKVPKLTPDMLKRRGVKLQEFELI